MIGQSMADLKAMSGLHAAWPALEQGLGVFDLSLACDEAELERDKCVGLRATFMVVEVPISACYLHWMFDSHNVRT